MASQEVDNAELGTALSSGAPSGQPEPEGVNNSVYQPIDGSQDYEKTVLQTLGAIQILNGAVILALGVFLGSLQYLTHLFRYFFFFTFYTGYPMWGAVFFISSGTLSVVAGRKPTRVRMQNSFGMNIASATIALVGIVFLSINLAVNIQSIKSCQSSKSPDLCIYMGSSSNGLVSLMLILTLVELCITTSVSTMWCKANCCNLREATSSTPSSVESAMPPHERNSETMKIQP
ncbi:membrane-spanning 4-domains subfamily A member 3 [Microcebus murinus]|nr:membrane-spanning 4-domains subfamily A member 3 [Microcebus murinus]